MNPYQLRKINAEKHAEVYGRYEGKPVIAQLSTIDRGVRAHGEPKRAAVRWSKHMNSSDVLPRALRHARSAKFI